MCVAVWLRLWVSVFVGVEDDGVADGALAEEQHERVAGEDDELS